MIGSRIRASALYIYEVFTTYARVVVFSEGLGHRMILAQSMLGG